MAARAILLVVAAAACGRIGFDSVVAGGDARDESDANGDARADASFSSRAWQLRSAASQPGDTRGPEMVWDSKRGRILIYGGEAGVGPRSDMWELTGAGWKLICDPCLPGARLYPAFGYDLTRDRVVLYGGLGTSGPLDTLWEFDGATWLQVTTVAPLPGPRTMATFVFHEQKQQLFLVGGTVGATPTAELFVFTGGAWISVPAGLGPGQVAGSGTTVTYDPSLGLVALRDSDGSPDRDELWAWNDGWTQICANCTGRRRSSASVIHDRALGVNYIINGFDSSAEIAGTFGVAGSTVTTLSASLPPDRDSSGVAYDTNRDVIVLFGGNGNSCNGDCDQTWELVPQ